MKSIMRVRPAGIPVAGVCGRLAVEPKQRYLQLISTRLLTPSPIRLVNRRVFGFAEICRFVDIHDAACAF